MHCPSWLSPVAKDFWRQHAPHIDLIPRNKESFAVLCQTYSDYRQAIAANDARQQKAMLEIYIKLAKEFGLIRKPEKETKVGELDEIFP